MSALMHRWFVQYNPLYFASALFVLLGVVLMTRDPLDWSHGQLALAGLIELYQLALIGGAALLFSLPEQRRPAVILGIVALAFMFDITFRTEALASIELLPASALWAALLAIKLALVARALRVRLPRLQTLAWTFTGLVLAAGPHFVREPFMLPLACWLGIGLAALVAWGRPLIVPRVPLDDWGRTVAGRIAGVLPLCWVVVYWLHVVAWCGIYELRFTPMCFVPAIALMPFLTRREPRTWVIAGAVMVAGYFAPAHFMAVAITLAIGLAVKAHTHRMPRLYGGAVMALAVPLALPWLPTKAGQWGAVLIAAGFVALGAGVALNWWSGRMARDADLRIRLPLLRP
jgi:hypothetical protein